MSEDGPRLVAAQRHDAEHPRNAGAGDRGVWTKGDHGDGGAAGDLQSKMRGGPARGSNQRARAVLGDEPGGLRAVGAPLVQAPAKDQRESAAGDRKSVVRERV